MGHGPAHSSAPQGCTQASSVSEAKLKEAILGRLAWHLDLWPMCNAMDNRRISTGLGPGSTDIVCILAPMGRWVCLEVKKPGEKPRPNQAKWLERARKMGAFAACVTSVDEAEAAYSRARKGLLG